VKKRDYKAELEEAAQADRDAVLVEIGTPDEQPAVLHANKIKALLAVTIYCTPADKLKELYAELWSALAPIANKYVPDDVPKPEEPEETP